MAQPAEPTKSQPTQTYEEWHVQQYGYPPPPPEHNYAAAEPYSQPVAAPDTSMYTAPVEAQYQPGGENYLAPYASSPPAPDYNYAAAEPYGGGGALPPPPVPSSSPPTEQGIGLPTLDWLGGLLGRYDNSPKSLTPPPGHRPMGARAPMSLAPPTPQPFVPPPNSPPLAARPPEWRRSYHHNREDRYHGVERAFTPPAPTAPPWAGSIPQMLGGRRYPVSQRHVEEQDRVEGQPFHGGIDVGVPVGTPFSMPADQGGEVMFVYDERSPRARAADNPGQIPLNYNSVLIRLDDGTEMVVSHLQAMEILSGQRLAPGQTIGSTGSVLDWAAFPGDPGHLHLGLIAPGGDELDPIAYFGSEPWYPPPPPPSELRRRRGIQRTS